MTDPRHPRCTVAAVLVLVVACIPPSSAARDEDKKPSLSLRATPPLGFSPLRVRTAVDVRGGADDYAEFYCASVEWDWGDGTVSESASDCSPYQAGKSTIRRRFTAEHVFQHAGAYKIVFKLKQKTRHVATANANVQVRAGSGEGFVR